MFRPEFKERVWGGRRLAAWFSELPPGPIGEAWVLSDHPQGPTVVSNGPLAGATLSDLTRRLGGELFGTDGGAGKTNTFPLLFKILDAEADLSVQVHPADNYDGLPPGELGKAEVWVVLHADPGAQAIYGLKPGTTPGSLADAVFAGQTMSVLNQISVCTGDVLFVPTGTVHALGAGLLVAEIQQSSDTVYRVYDYDRLGLDGKARELHIEHALRVCSFGPPPRRGRLPAQVSPNTWTVICQSPYFVVFYGQSATNRPWALTPTPNSFQVVMIIEGDGNATWPDGEEPLQLQMGDTLLIPANFDGDVTLQGEFRALLSMVPPPMGD